MRLTRWLGAVALVAPAGASGETVQSNATTLMPPRETNAIVDRVVMLTTARSDPSHWCMGLLIAPNAVLTYAHCVSYPQAPLAWAFFGDSKDVFFETTKPPGDGDVGDQDAWVAISKTIVHENYTSDGSAPTTDLAVVQLRDPRVTTDAFSLVANMAAFEAADGVNLEAFQLTTDFLTTSQTPKLASRGTFRKVSWSYCAPSRVPTIVAAPLKLLLTPPTGQLCAVASVVEHRRFEQLTNTFVMMDNKLVGLSVVSANRAATAVHRFIFLSEEASFITEATQKKDVFIAVSNLVVGGKDTPTLQGYIAGLRESKSGTNFCLGSLIAPKFVLTAAHCVAGVNFSQVSVGSMYVATEVDGEQIKVKRALVHPNYDAPTFRNDYAIIELEYISIQSPIFLYNGSGAETAPGKRLMFYGYGPSNGNAPGVLQSVELPVVDKKTCKAVLQPPVLDDSMLCAGGEEGKDACKGDSGGPLVYQSSTLPSLVAMASYGRGCAIKGVPAVYALVATASSFIDKNVDGHRWITAYGTDTSPAPTSGAPSPTSPSPAPSSATSNNPSAPMTTPAVTRLQEPRSGDTEPLTPVPSASLLDDIETKGGWTPVPTISLQDTSSNSLVIDGSYSQLTRDVVSSTILSTRSSWSSATTLYGLTPYAGAAAVAFYSTSDLHQLVSLISAFDARPLRRRQARFARSDNSTCLVDHR